MSEYKPELLGTPLNRVTFPGASVKTRTGYAVPVISNPSRPRERDLGYADITEYLRYLEYKIEDSGDNPIGEDTDTGVLIDGIQVQTDLNSTLYCKGVVSGDQYVEFFIVLDGDSVDASLSYFDAIYVISDNEELRVFSAVIQGVLKILLVRDRSSKFVLNKIEVGVMSGNGTIDASGVSLSDGSIFMPTGIPARIINGVIQSGRLADGIVEKSNLNYETSNSGTQFYLIKSAGSSESIGTMEWNSMVGLMNATQYCTHDISNEAGVTTNLLYLDNDNTVKVSSWVGDLTIYMRNANSDYYVHFTDYTIDNVGPKITIYNPNNYICTIKLRNSTIYELAPMSACEFRFKNQAGTLAVNENTFISYRIS